ncbi:MAG: Trk system potassium transporter TrkA [Prevotellaceae bacterium]|nr:Trk system potassium transporter TrkA [Prevotellaceae bacterium]
MKIIITGAKAIGSHLAKLLSRNNEDVTLIDEDGERLSQLAADLDILTLQAPPCSLSTLKEVGTGKADLFIAVTSDENQNVQACLMAKLLGAKKVVAKVDNPEYTEKDAAEFYQRLGLDSIIYPELLAGNDIINGLKMSWVRQRWDVHGGALVMLGIKLRAGCEILEQPLRNLCGPNDPYHVVAIKRGIDTIIPGGNDMLQLNDLAYFMTTRQYIPYIRKIVGKETYADVKNVMIMGGGKTAVRSIKMMPEYMHAKVFEIDEQRCERLNELVGDRCLVINGDGRDLGQLTEEGIRNCQAFVALTGNAEANILACLMAKRIGVRKTVAMIENIDYINMAESLDIGTIINKKAIAASHIYQMMLDANVRNVRFLTTANADVAEFIAEENSKVTRKLVKDLSLPRGMTIGGLVRGNEGMLVSGMTQIQPGDAVVVFMHGTNIKRVEDLFK